MAARVVLTTSELSYGARVMLEALGRAGVRAEHAQLWDDELLAAADVCMDWSLPPYELPVRVWRGMWWNRPDRSCAAWSKERTAVVAARCGLAHPSTVVFESLAHVALDPDSVYVSEFDRAAAVLESLGGRVVVKPDRGMLGHGVVLVDSVDGLVSAMRSLGRGVVQEFVPEAGVTHRLVCVSGRVVASYARVCGLGEWRVSGVSESSVVPTRVSESDPAGVVALRAMRALGLDLAGVDVVEASSGPVFLGANPVFGVQGLLGLFPRALDKVVEALLVGVSARACGSSVPHDAWARCRGLFCSGAVVAVTGLRR